MQRTKRCTVFRALGRQRMFAAPPRVALYKLSLRAMSTAPKPANEPARPRPSASLIVVNADNEVLLVHRNPNATSFAGMHVFPGGNFDAAQDDSYQLTAIRETFEEAGVLLASGTSTGAAPPSDATLDAARAAVHANRTRFADFLRQHGLAADTRALLPFTEWITPPPAPRRFHTRFYVAFLPADAPAHGFAAGAAQHRLPTPDGGQEVVAARFVRPRVALAEHAARRIALMPPQHYLLSTLADALERGGAARVRALAAGAFGRMVVEPRAGRRDAEGRTPLVFEGDEARGGPEGRLHRALVRLSPETKLPMDIVLLRNFDVFTELEVPAKGAEPSKL
ncbi:NUDIX hydrolase domain-like protein [Gloeopeniophorella convolvens]|nr:NUDIX hydrolase domain-like protein [Gloeopeniophorella convolvens]